MASQSLNPVTVATRPPRRRWIRGLVAFVIVGSGYWPFVRFVTFNVHTVRSGERGVYRSCQMPPDRLAAFISRHEIKAVLKLNSVKESAWSRAEQAAVEAAGAKFIYLKLPVTRLPRRQEMIDLLAAVESAPRPLLIHCKSGADRTGVACGLVRMLAGESCEEAERKELRLAYLHVGHIGDDVTDVFDEYRRYKAERGEPCGGWPEFAAYIREVYRVGE